MAIAVGAPIDVADFSWNDWTPTLTNLTKGSGGLITARYMQMGKTVMFFFFFTYGTGSAVGTNPIVSLPVAMSAQYTTYSFSAQGRLLHSGVGLRQAQVTRSTTTSIQVDYWDATPTNQPITATAPWTWASGDQIVIWGNYEAA